MHRTAPIEIGIRATTVSPRVSWVSWVNGANVVVDGGYTKQVGF